MARLGTGGDERRIKKNLSTSPTAAMALVMDERNTQWEPCRGDPLAQINNDIHSICSGRPLLNGKG
ncbi:MAG: hypothetical protein RIE73_16120 [Coleofasciculus sp. C1-SOL-03]|jgi:hypothetical protein